MEKIAIENALCAGDYDVVVCRGGYIEVIVAIAVARDIDQ